MICVEAVERHATQRGERFTITVTKTGGPRRSGQVPDVPVDSLPDDIRGALHRWLDGEVSDPVEESDIEREMKRLFRDDDADDQ